MRLLLILSAFLLSANLIGPAVARGDVRNHHEKRYYDREGHDYHTWNSNENHAYRAYLQEQHRDYREFNRVNRGRQQQYFKWRHTHPDSAIIKVEIR